MIMKWMTWIYTCLVLSISLVALHVEAFTFRDPRTTTCASRYPSQQHAQQNQPLSRWTLRHHNDKMIHDSAMTTTTTSSSRRGFGHVVASTLGGIVTSAMLIGCTSSSRNVVANARLESVNRPDLLPTARGQNVIQIEKFLTSGEVKRIEQVIAALERDTGYRLRVLCQAYPRTPGLAIKDYWGVGKDGQKDDKYIVLVVDQFGGRGNILNFNVGDGVKLALPNVFWTRLQNKYGTTFYVKENGIDLAIISAIESIATCLRSEDQFCTSPPDTMPSFRSLGLS